MKYISIGIIMLISFIISVVITKVEIPVLKRKAGQNIREDGPQSHLSKAGTPSMGGIAIIIAASLTTIGAAVMGKIDGLGCAIILLVFVGFGLIGFFDDYLKVIKKNNLGLRAYQKFGLQTILSVILAVYLANYTEGSTSVYIPFADIYKLWYLVYPVCRICRAGHDQCGESDGWTGRPGLRCDGIHIAVFCSGRLYLRHCYRSVFL